MFTKEQLEEKIKGIDEEIVDHQNKVTELESKRGSVIQNLINNSPDVQKINLEINTLVAGMNRLNGKKDVFLDLSAQFNPVEVEPIEEDIVEDEPVVED